MLFRSENSATSIVDTNATCELLNLRKAQTNCAQSGQPLVMCATMDKCATEGLTESERHQLLTMDFSSAKVKQTLPGFVPLYIGMPVVLRTKNLSTDLGIMNGAQGVLKLFHTTVSDNDLVYCKCAIVGFLKSKVHLPGLEACEFPILPISTSFTMQNRDNSDSVKIVKIRRTQLPLQPTFSITGHSAQGKTLVKIISRLHKGGFGSYVAASRAQT